MYCRVVRRALLSVSAILAACSSEGGPDARVFAPGASPDAAAAAPDARAPGADGRPADGPLVSPDAPPPRPADAPPPDALPPDAPPPGPATLLVNELSPDFPSQHDLVELLVVAAGTTAGIQLEAGYRNPTVLARLPDLVVATGDLVVVHLSPAGTTAAAESAAKDEKPTADNFATAWDVLGEAVDLAYADVVVAVRGADGKIASAVPFYRSDLVDPDQFRSFPAEVQALIDDGLWKDVCAPAPCTVASDFSAVAVDWKGAGTARDPATAAGASVARKPGGANDARRGDWQALAGAAPFNSYGAAN